MQAVRLWECSWATQCLQEVPGVSERAADKTTSPAVEPQRSFSLLQTFMLVAIVGERRHLLQQCVSGDDVICHFATIRIRFGPTLQEARRLHDEL
jgi:hypothetical protein